MNSPAKGLLTLSIALGLALVSVPAWAGTVSGEVVGISYPTLKAPASLNVSVRVKNHSGKKVKIVGWKAGVGTACSLGNTESKLLADGSGADFSKRMTCAWSKIAALPGCGPNKTSCSVTVTGSVKYQVASGASTVVQFRKHTVTVKKAGPMLTPVK